MLIRTVLTMATVAVGVTGVLAQNDIISQRQEMMKQNSKHTKAINAMVKGEAPFDAAAVNAGFSVWADTAAKLPKLFPANSKSGGDTRALPKIWDDNKGFDAQVAAFAKASSAKPGNIEELKTAFSAVNKACGDCHEGYRAAAKKK